MNNNNNLLIGLTERLLELLEEREDIFFEERPWLENSDIVEPEIIPQDERREQVSLEIKATTEAIEKLVSIEIPKSDIEQKGLGFGT